MSNLAKYICEKCEYSTNNKTNYNIHLLTPKHKMRYNAENFVVKRARAYKCKYCKKRYKHQQSLWRHSKVCPEILKMKKKEDEDDLINQLREEIKMKDRIIEMKNEIIENSSKPNNFNLTIFLNEDCKNAINMSDFIKSIEVSLEQLDLTKTKGLEKGITQVIMDNMNKLSVHERPLHCTDTKRETLYIKDDDKWEKDKNKTKIKEVIKKASNKNYTALKKWQDENPDYLDDDAKAIYYAKAMSAAGKPIDAVDEKIIKNVCKQTYVKEDIKE